MKFAKGIFIGSLLAAGVIMMYRDNEMMNMNPKKITKKGKQLVKKMGIL